MTSCGNRLEGKYNFCTGGLMEKRRASKSLLPEAAYPFADTAADPVLARRLQRLHWRASKP
jgi:hypothetical protein